MTICHKTLFY